MSVCLLWSLEHRRKIILGRNVQISYLVTYTMQIVQVSCSIKYSIKSPTPRNITYPDNNLLQSPRFQTFRFDPYRIQNSLLLLPLGTTNLESLPVFLNFISKLLLKVMKFLGFVLNWNKISFREPVDNQQYKPIDALYYAVINFCKRVFFFIFAIVKLAKRVIKTKKYN